MQHVKKASDGLKYHLVDSTAMIASSYPIYVLFETTVNGMSDDVSRNTKIYGALLAYGGLGTVISKGRDFFRKAFNITQRTPEKIQRRYDSAYFAAINLPICSGLYISAGETDISKIAIGTLFGMGLGAFGGSVFGYAIDVYRDLTGLNECERKLYPNFLKKLNLAAKRGVAVALTAASMGSLGLIYYLTPDKNDKTTIDNRVSEEILVQELYSNEDYSANPHSNLNVI